MQSFRPCAALRSRVLSIDIVESAGGETTVLPSSSAVLGFQYRGRVHAGALALSNAGITGIQQGPRVYAYERGTGSLLVRFTPQGAACLGLPASQITGHSVPLDAILPAAGVREAIERLQSASTQPARVALVEQLLMTLPFAQDRVIARAIELLSGPLPVAQVAKTLALSERQLERRFLSRVGITPKRFATLRRFERALELARRAPSLSHLALDSGYYDQSHFIREFRGFAGMAPSALLGRLR